MSESDAPSPPGRSFRYVLTVLVLVQACAVQGPRRAVPEELADAAGIPDVPLARSWGDAMPANIDDRLALLRVQTAGNVDPARPYDILALSGGGPDGAFGAGLLKGWTESGTRPEFRIVTGISTGALIAPFAFLGPAHDPALERIYTQSTQKDLIRRRPVIGLFRDALADTEPLREQIARYIDDEVVATIAAEYRKGRRLLIGTTHLDARRSITWNIGAIADSGIAGAKDLIHDIILASAAIPGLFPPVRIKVEVQGRTYDELHVDGGATAQVFLYPMATDLARAATVIGIESQPRIFVIRNSKVHPEWKVVQQRLLPIAKASIDALIDNQGDGDLYRLYLQAKTNGFEYRLAHVPDDFEFEAKESFDSSYMNALFRLGYELARDGYPWQTSPPGTRRVSPAPQARAGQQ